MGLKWFKKVIIELVFQTSFIIFNFILYRCLAQIKIGISKRADTMKVGATPILSNKAFKQMRPTPVKARLTMEATDKIVAHSSDLILWLIKTEKEILDNIMEELASATNVKHK